MDILKQCLMGIIRKVQHDKRASRFEEVIGHYGIKLIFAKAILSKRPVHLLLVGSPGSAKTMFLTEIMREHKASYFVVGSNTTKAGLVNQLFERRPKFLLIDELEKMISLIQPLWISEHLSFNKVKSRKNNYNTGFFLPPFQNHNTISNVVKNIKIFYKFFSIPLAIENGVNYLKSREDELEDGEFMAKISNLSQCNILLDLHNLYTNQLNNRQSIKQFLNQIPLEQVWEIHLAGGTEDSGYWLDSHSGEIPSTLTDMAKKIIPCLPNLKAIIFEIEPSYIQVVGNNVIHSQLKILHKLWNLRINSFAKRKTPSYKTEQKNNCPINDINPTKWENLLGSLIFNYYSGFNDLTKELMNDPGVNVYKKRIAIVRSSMITKTLLLTSRLILLVSGINKFHELLSEYCKITKPELFAGIEGLRFARFILKKQIEIPYLKEIVSLEIAILKKKLYKKRTRLKFCYDPVYIIESLRNRKIPDCPREGNYEFVVG